MNDAGLNLVLHGRWFYSSYSNLHFVHRKLDYGGEMRHLTIVRLTLRSNNAALLAVSVAAQ